jgi:hypothetical protein
MKRLLATLLCSVCGCTTVAKKTIQATGAVAETTLKVGGKVTKRAVATTIDVVGTALKKGAVTVIDIGTGVSRKVPWEEGLRVSKIQTGGRAVQIMRGAKKIKGTADTALRAGDVVRLQ